MQPHPYLINIDPYLSKKIIDDLKLKVIFLAKTKKDKEFYEKKFKQYFTRLFTIKMILTVVTIKILKF